MPEDELKFLCRDTTCLNNKRPYCKVAEEGRPVIIGPGGLCEQREEKKEEAKHEG
mgnify:CR=1 FL=1